MYVTKPECSLSLWSADCSAGLVVNAALQQYSALLACYIMGNICSRRDYLNFCEARQAHRNGLINPSYVINNAPVYPYAFCNPSTYPHLRQPIHPHLYQPIHPHFHQPTHRRLHQPIPASIYPPTYLPAPTNATEISPLRSETRYTLNNGLLTFQ